MLVYLNLITGLCFGAEFLGKDDVHEGDAWALNFDPGIFRITFVKQS